MTKYVLDTDHIIEVLKGKSDVVNRLQSVVLNGDDVSISGIAYWETKRGFLELNATARLAAFDAFCRLYGLILLGSRGIFDRAAQIDAEQRARGTQIPDADVLTASVAVEGNLVLVTSDGHFGDVPELKTESWM